MSELELKYALVTETFSDVLWKQAIGVDIGSAQIRRTVPVRIYISDKLDKENDELPVSFLKELIWDFASKAEFVSLFELPDEFGSFRKIAGAISKWLGTEQDALDKIEQLEAAARTILLDKPTAEVGAIQAKAAAEVIAQLAEFDDASVQLGNMMVVKRTLPDGRKILISGLLSQTNLQKLEQNYVELIKPENAHHLLEVSGSCTVVEQEALNLRSSIVSETEGLALEDMSRKARRLKKRDPRP